MNIQRFRIQITKTGYLFLLLALSLGFGALNTGNNLLYLLFAMMLSFIVLSGILSQNSLYLLEPTAHLTLKTYANTPFTLSFEVKNNKTLFPAYAISISPVRSNTNLPSTFIAKLKSQGKCLSGFLYAFDKRGWNLLPNLKFETTYPFGLVKKFFIFESGQKTLVYPTLLPLKQTPQNITDQFGDASRIKKGESGHPHGVRDFVFGDPHRYIHWKSSARIGKLRVKEFEKQNQKIFKLHLRIQNPHLPLDTQETLISIAASLITAASMQNMVIILVINHKSIDNPSQSLDVFLSALALFQITPPAQATLEPCTVLISDEPTAFQEAACISPANLQDWI